MKEEKEFVWTDDLILKFVNFTLNESSAFQGREQDLEEFKEAKSKKEVKPTVCYYGASATQIHFINELDSSNLSVSKERLAEILIAESKGLICVTDENYCWYREDAVMQKVEDAFKAAREKKAEGISLSSLSNQFNQSPIYVERYKSFKEYMDLTQNK